MGLCKCPKRKVTNLFCFEHRVNVCEHCLVENHARCVVQSYLNWLKDSDYNPDCQLCNKPLASGNVVRLLCYDVFHEACLDRHYEKLPSNTAPAGYKCQLCETNVFPAPNQAGKVIDQLKECLSKFNWARIGLGLPLIDESEIIEVPESDLPEDEMSGVNTFVKDEGQSREHENLHGSSIPKPDFNLSSSTNVSDTSWMKNSSLFTDYSPPNNKSHSTVLTMDDFPATGGSKVTDELGAVSRKLLGGNLPDSLRQTVAGNDPDSEDKYKRRPAWTWLMRWLRSRMLRARGRGYHDMNVIPKKVAILILVGIIAFFTIVIFATQVGRKRAEENPFLDPMANPNIHVAHHGDAGLDYGGGKIRQGQAFLSDDKEENIGFVGRRQKL
uniref:zinc finger protein-like 1 n=1 Tax=Styela clava TaxID=7725 RepID=UPI0019399967|nr:zinc finger protein-like 1 [Styela clava]